MKTIQAAAEACQQSIELRKQLPQGKPQRALPARIIDHLWKRMAEIYGHKWTSSYGSADTDGTWAKSLADLTQQELAKGYGACIASGDPWPPSLPQFRALCRPPKLKREQADAYIAPPSRQLPHLLSDERRARGRAAVADAIAMVRQA